MSEITIEPADEASNAGDDHVEVVEPLEPPTTSKQHVPRRAPSPLGQAVSGNDVDTISLASCVFKNKFAQKSLTIHHVQRRLIELGYPDAYNDRDGWYGDLTKLAVAAYQKDNGLDGDGVIDLVTLQSLFADDKNVAIEE